MDVQTIYDSKSRCLLWFIVGWLLVAVVASVGVLAGIVFAAGGAVLGAALTALELAAIWLFVTGEYQAFARWEAFGGFLFISWIASIGLAAGVVIHRDGNLWLGIVLAVTQAGLIRFVVWFVEREHHHSNPELFDTLHDLKIENAELEQTVAQFKFTCLGCDRYTIDRGESTKPRGAQILVPVDLDLLEEFRKTCRIYDESMSRNLRRHILETVTLQKEITPQAFGSRSD